MRRRNATAAGSSSRASSRKRFNSDILPILRIVIVDHPRQSTAVCPTLRSKETRVGPFRGFAGNGASDYALFTKRDYLGELVSEAGEDLIGVLPHQRGGAAVGAGGLRQLDRRRRQRQAALDPGECRLVEQPRGADMRVIKRLLRGVDLACDDAGLF